VSSSWSDLDLVRSSLTSLPRRLPAIAETIVAVKDFQ
jgi:hypothetical protein